MKVELKVNDQNIDKGANADEITVQSPSCDVAIDVGHILAANQALLKNMARKMNNLEQKISSLETAYCEQTKLLKLSQKRQLMIDAPAKKIDVWRTDLPDLDNQYLDQFSMLDKVFRPWKMRRNKTSN